MPTISDELFDIRMRILQADSVIHDSLLHKAVEEAFSPSAMETFVAPLRQSARTTSKSMITADFEIKLEQIFKHGIVSVSHWDGSPLTMPKSFLWTAEELGKWREFYRQHPILKDATNRLAGLCGSHVIMSPLYISQTDRGTPTIRIPVIFHLPATIMEAGGSKK